jgi:single-strand DNA-binding protein
MNCLSIAGNVGRDAELRQVNTANGAQSVLSFAVAVKSSKKGDDGKYLSDWFDCSLWGKRADSLAQYIKKGSSVAVFGEVSLEQYTTTQGQAGAKMKINVQNVTLLGGGQQQPQQAAQAPQQPMQQPQAPRPAPAQYNQAPNPKQFAQAPQQQYAASPQPIDFEDDIPF